jgi:hypothetical protein
MYTPMAMSASNVDTQVPSKNGTKPEPWLPKVGNAFTKAWNYLTETGPSYEEVKAAEREKAIAEAEARGIPRSLAEAKKDPRISEAMYKAYRASAFGIIPRPTWEAQHWQEFVPNYGQTVAVAAPQPTVATQPEVVVAAPTVVDPAKAAVVGQTTAVRGRSVAPYPSQAATANNYIGLVDWMNQHNMNSSKENRRALAAQLGVENYDFSAAKNQQLLGLLQRMDEMNQPGSSSDLFAQTPIVTPRPAQVVVTPTEPVITMPSIAELLAATAPTEEASEEEPVATAELPSNQKKLSRKEKKAAKRLARDEYNKKIREINAARKGGKVNYFKFY